MDPMRRLPAIMAATALLAVAACSHERKEFMPPITDPSAVPTMTTRDVETFITDSGYTRYHISTALWQIYDDADEPYWRFPEGLFLEQYDDRLRPAADITCDSAVYLSRRRLWRLDGHVVMVNTLRDSFITSQLFWDQTRQEVYSDSFIHIVRSDRVIEGYGFKSNQNMTAYTVNNPTGILPIQRPEGDGDGAVAPADSDSTASAAMPAGNRRRPTPRSASQRAIDAGDARVVPVLK